MTVMGRRGPAVKDLPIALACCWRPAATSWSHSSWINMQVNMEFIGKVCDSEIDWL